MLILDGLNTPQGVLPVPAEVGELNAGAVPNPTVPALDIGDGTGGDAVPVRPPR